MSLEDALIEELRRVHGVHTLILYGSRARGDATPESDVDVAGFADVAETTRDARLWDGLFLDAFIHPTAMAAAAPQVEMLKLERARVLFDERGLAGPLLAGVAALAAKGPPKLAEHEARMRRVWAKKMLARIARGDVEAHYRQHWLLFQLLEDHFALRGVWYRGPKEGLVDLAASDPETFSLFERALAPGAPLAAIEELVRRVTGASSDSVAP